MRTYAVLAALSAAFIGSFLLFRFGPLHHNAKSRDAKTRHVGMTVDLVGCYSSSSSFGCLAVYRGRCVVLRFSATDGTPDKYLPVKPKFCGL